MNKNCWPVHRPVIEDWGAATSCTKIRGSFRIITLTVYGHSTPLLMLADSGWVPGILVILILRN